MPWKLTPKFWSSYVTADMATVLERILDTGFDAEVLLMAPWPGQSFSSTPKAVNVVQVDVGSSTRPRSLGLCDCA